MDGMGIYTWKDGRCYKGYRKKNYNHGFGIFIWPDSRKYMGMWYQNKEHGLGVYSNG